MMGLGLLAVYILEAFSMRKDDMGEHGREFSLGSCDILG